MDREAGNEDRWLALMLILIYGADHVEIYREGVWVLFEDDDPPHDGP